LIHHIWKMQMPTITINSNDYFSYASVSDADLYLSPISATWLALTNDEKGGYLIQATRYLDTLPWTNVCGTTSEERSSKQNIINATSEIAFLIFNDSAPFLSSSGAEGNGIKRLKADVAEIEYQSSWQQAKFASSPFYGLPTRILKMLPPCISISTQNVGGIISFGTDSSLVDTDFSYNYNLGRY